MHLKTWRIACMGLDQPWNGLQACRCPAILFAALALLLLVPGGSAAGRGAHMGHDGTTTSESAGVGPVALSMATFNHSMVETEAPYSLCEFYASWCPACMNFKPQYEKVGALFNAAPPADAFVYVAAVDCATETALCQQFHVDRYPTMLWGEPAQFAANLQSGVDSRKGLQAVETARTAEAVLGWINAKTGQSFSLTASVEATRSAGGQARAVVQQTRARQAQPLLVVELQDIEEATALAFQYMLATLTSATAASVRANVTRFAHLLAEHHPSARCRTGVASLVAHLDSLWPVSALDGPAGASAPLQLEALQQVAVCGVGIPRTQKGAWRTCQGSRPETRGYSCGLWLLFHAVASRVDAWEGRACLDALRGFVDVGFHCDECRTHFLEASTTRDAAAVESQHDVALWLWGMHNEVNQRLAGTENASGSGDPAFPKQLWPPRHACPECRTMGGGQNRAESGVEWDEEAVGRFLSRHYGHPVGDNPEGLAVGWEQREMRWDVWGKGRTEPPVEWVVGGVAVVATVGAGGWWWQKRRRRRKSPLYSRVSKE